VSWECDRPTTHLPLMWVCGGLQSPNQLLQALSMLGGGCYRASSWGVQGLAGSLKVTRRQRTRLRAGATQQTGCGQKDTHG
jgi:hypothetical protein